MKKIFVFVLISLISCKTIKQANSKEISFNTLYKGISELNIAEGLYECNSNEEFEKFTHLSSETIDFSKYKVLALVDKVKTTGGFGIKVLSIKENDSEIICSYTKTGPAANQMVTMVLTQPCQIIKIKKNKKKIIFNLVE